jgi:tRNA/rRNA methyltransferase
MTRFILIEPSHPGNVGAVARSMKVMGFDDLVLVAPRYADVLHHDETRSLASGAVDVLNKARVVTELEEALDGISTTCATVMTPRDFGPATHMPRALLPSLAQSPHSVAFIFGSERFGLSNETVYCCHHSLSIPTCPEYGSLNLAQAVQLIAYEWRQALGGFALTTTPQADVHYADAQSVQRLLQHWREALLAVDFLDPAVPKKLMPRLNQLLNRQQLTQEELHLLHGMARAVLQKASPHLQEAKSP